MQQNNYRWLKLGTSSLIGAGLLGLTATVNSAFAFADDVALVMGGSGDPVPSPLEVQAAQELYINALHPGYVAQPLFTPEGAAPITGVSSLALDPSVKQGVTILNDTINEQLGAGNNLVVLGYSQSTVISGLEQQALDALPLNQQPSPDQLSFILLGPPSAPDGGLLTRFHDLAMPALNYNWYEVNPSDTVYPTDIFTQEYDGFADFPKYPINFLSDLNAMFGINYLHTDYYGLTPQQIAPVEDGGTAITLATSPGYDGDTTYFMIPTENLPILDPLQQLDVPKALLDLVQPDLRVLIDLGYGSVDQGWSTGYADVLSPLGFLPNLDPTTVWDALVQGADQGISQFEQDLPALPSELASFLDPTTLPSRVFDVIQSLGLDPSAYASTTPPATPLDAITSVISNDAQTLLADGRIALTALESLPSYDATLFTDQLEAGNFLAAIGDPISADVGAAAWMGFFTAQIDAATFLGNLADLGVPLP